MARAALEKLHLFHWKQFGGEAVGGGGWRGVGVVKRENERRGGRDQRSYGGCLHIVARAKSYIMHRARDETRRWRTESFDRTRSVHLDRPNVEHHHAKLLPILVSNK